MAAEVEAKEAERRGNRRNHCQAHTGAKPLGLFSGVWIWDLVDFSRLFILSTSTTIKLYSTALLPMIAVARLLLVPYLLCLGCGFG